MTRISKQQERRHQYPRKRKRVIIEKTGPKKDNLPLGFKEHACALPSENSLVFIPKIK
jgi:hypothetical protein